MEDLPKTNQCTLQALFSFFSLLASYESENKMTPQNIAIVMAPIMLRSPSPDLFTKQNESVKVITDLIELSKDVFVDIKNQNFTKLSADLSSSSE